MKTKIFTLFLFLLISINCEKVWGVTTDSINGIWYNFKSYNETASVTKPSGAASYSGDVIIPQTVIYKGNTYVVNEIEAYAFSHCATLTSVDIPNSVTSIANYAFKSCPNLTSITINSNSLIGKNYPYTKASMEDIFGAQVLKYILGDSIIEIGEYVFANCDSLKTVIIPNSISSIKRGAFYHCENLTSINLPSCITEINDYLFNSCYKLPSVNIPSSVTSIGSYAFYGCSSLASITLPNSVTKISDGAFKNSGLRSLTIPENVATIGKDAFTGSGIAVVTWNAKKCADLINYDKDNIGVGGVLNFPTNPFFGNNSIIKSFLFGNSVEYVPNAVCCGMSNLTSVVIGENVKEIGLFAFNNCDKLSSIEWNAKKYNKAIINEHLDASKKLTHTPFYVSITYGQNDHGQNDLKNSAPNIKKIIIGPQVEWAYNVFYQMKNVKMVICKALTPPIVGYTSFNFSSSIPLCVPSQSIEIYKSHEFWKSFNPIIPFEAIEDGINEVAIIPTDSSLVIEWPENEEAVLYAIEIKKNSETICTLNFNANGLILSASFAVPIRNSENQVQKNANMTETGWRYEFCGLAWGQYSYSIIARDENDEVLYDYAGYFKIGTESMEDIQASSMSQKALRNGQILILRGQKVYTVTGQEVR